VSRPLRLLAIAVLVAAPAALLPAAPVPAQPGIGPGTPVFPGLDHHRQTFTLPDGRPAVANILRFDPTDPMLELRPALGQDAIPGLETVVSMGQRHVHRGGVAGINAGFWQSNPPGDPNGFLALEGRLVSEAETQGTGPRGTYALMPDGRVVMDRLGTRVSLFRGEPSNGGWPVTAINRLYRSSGPFPDGPDPIYVYDRTFGPTITPSGTTPEPTVSIIVSGLQLAATGWSEGHVQAVLTTRQTVPIPADGAVVVAHGQSAIQLANTPVAELVSVHVELFPAIMFPSEWDGLVSGLAAGPLLVKDGVPTDPSWWHDEGFADLHWAVRHPRSAIATTYDGKALLVTVDGRQPGYSHGMTLHELAHYLRLIGVRDAVSLDGGGSTQMAVDGVLRNRPCCDTTLRPVATGLFIYHRYRFEATSRLAGAGREATAAAISAVSHPRGSGEVILAAAGNFPDALAGGPLASAQGAPLLLTATERLSEPTRVELARLSPLLVTILGGTGVVSPTVESELRARGYTVRRIAGRDRTETAAAIAGTIGQAHQRAFVAYQGDFPDALSAASPAGILGMPILLTAGGHLPDATRVALITGGVREVVIVGGEARISRRVVDELQAMGIAVSRLAGPNRYGTSRAINEWAEAQIPDLDARELVVAVGTRFPDALAGGPFAASRRQLLMIVPPRDVYAEAEAAAYLRRRASGPLEQVTLLGGHGVLGSYPQWQLDRLVLD
jgi:putative cell wall-binding protein